MMLFSGAEPSTMTRDRAQRPRRAASPAVEDGQAILALANSKQIIIALAAESAKNASALDRFNHQSCLFRSS
jgi:hypothetical protein